jgi:hypothetical protein
MLTGAAHALKPHRHQDGSAQHDRLEGGRNVEQRQRAAHDRHDRDAEQHSGRRDAGAARAETQAADHRGGDHVELIAGADADFAAAEVGGQEHAAARGQEPGYGERDQLEPVDRHAGQARGPRIRSAVRGPAWASAVIVRASLSLAGLWAGIDPLRNQIESFVECNLMVPRRKAGGLAAPPAPIASPP